MVCIASICCLLESANLLIDMIVNRVYHLLFAQLDAHALEQQQRTENHADKRYDLGNALLPDLSATESLLERSDVGILSLLAGTRNVAIPFRKKQGKDIAKELNINAGVIIVIGAICVAQTKVY